MHEMSLAEGVLQLIEDAAREQNFAKVTTVWLEIGQLSGVEVEAMKFCFDAVTRDSVAAGAPERGRHSARRMSSTRSRASPITVTGLHTRLPSLNSRTSEKSMRTQS